MAGYLPVPPSGVVQTVQCWQQGDGGPEPASGCVGVDFVWRRAGKVIVRQESMPEGATLLTEAEYNAKIEEWIESWPT